MRSLSFKVRLALTIAALILLISAAVWIYVPQKLEEEATALIAHKAETLAHLTAFTVHPAVYFQDKAALEEALSGTRQDRDVSYVIVSDVAGRRLAAFRPERATAPAQARRSQGGAVSPDGRLYEVMTPIREGQREIARLYIGMSLSRMNSRIAHTRIAIGIFSAAILVLGLIAAVLTSSLMTRPLRQLADGARQIASGRFEARIPARRGDELGQVAEAFNDMAARLAGREASLRQSHDQLRTLSRRLLSIQEEERIRIAREVHDELGQALTAMKIDLQQLGRQNAPVDQHQLTAIARTIDETVDVVRRIAADLRPAILDDLGISAALEKQLRRLRETNGLETRLTVAEEPRLDTLTGATLYRIAQEGLANVVRHAGASEVEVSLAIRDGAAVLKIMDNGRGITRDQISSTGSLGLVGIRERAELLGGHVNIEGKPGEGTSLKVTLPLARDDRDLASSMR